jgi:Holliday junction resolvase-like predicted endonuclease
MKMKSRQEFFFLMSMKYFHKSHDVRRLALKEINRRQRRKLMELQRLYVQSHVYWTNKTAFDVNANGVDLEARKSLNNYAFNAHMTEQNLFN